MKAEPFLTVGLVPRCRAEHGLNCCALLLGILPTLGGLSVREGRTAEASVLAAAAAAGLVIRKTSELKRLQFT